MELIIAIRMDLNNKKKKTDNRTDLFIKWIGSFSSLIVHTLFFLLCFMAGILFGRWESILLVLTTVVSLEAIYLAIFIQMSINRNTESLQAVEKDIDEIQEDVEELQEDVDKVQEGVEGIQEDVEELQEDDKEDETAEAQNRKLMKDIQEHLMRIGSDLEQLKKIK